MSFGPPNPKPGGDSDKCRNRYANEKLGYVSIQQSRSRLLSPLNLTIDEYCNRHYCSIRQ